MTMPALRILDLESCAAIKLMGDFNRFMHNGGQKYRSVHMVGCTVRFVDCQLSNAG